jgi:hypothetical protein
MRKSKLLILGIVVACIVTGCTFIPAPWDPTEPPSPPPAPPEPPDPDEPALVAKLGHGGGDPFIMFWYGQITVRMNKILAAAEELECVNTQVRVMLSHRFQDKDGKWWGQRFCPYKVFNDVASGFNQPFFDKVREYCRECNKRGVVPVLEIIDGNWLHLDPFSTKHGIKGAYYTGLKLEQKQYIDKLVETVDGLAVIFIVSNERYTGTRARSLSAKNEEIVVRFRESAARAAPLVPTKMWMQEAVNYVKSTSGRKVGVWHEYGSVTNKDFIVIHSGWYNAAAGRVCNEEPVEGMWGGEASVEGYKTCARRLHENKAHYQFAFWEWALFNGVFAPRQREAMEWARAQGWY